MSAAIERVSMSDQEARLRAARIDPLSLGNLLVTHGILTLDEIDLALEYAGQHRVRLGEALIDLKWIDGRTLEFVLDHQAMERSSSSVARGTHAAAMVIAATTGARSIEDSASEWSAVAHEIAATFGQET